MRTILNIPLYLRPSVAFRIAHRSGPKPAETWVPPRPLWFGGECAARESLCRVVDEGQRHPTAASVAVGMQSLPPSPTGPTPLAAPPHAEAWRSRFVISAKANTPTLTLLGSGHESPIHRLVEVTCAALASKTAPVLVDDGLGGTYFIKGSDGTCASPRFEPGTRVAPQRPARAYCLASSQARLHS